MLGDFSCILVLIKFLDGGVEVAVLFFGKFYLI